jgi:fimbrial isopeptide formation D2 family protein/LPXTG-motif cell wall-anchored protein
MKKLISLFLALAMILMVGAAFATEGGTGEGASAAAGKITVTPPDNTTDDSSNTYVLYKVFDAVTNGTAYTYKLAGKHTAAPTGFILDDAGNIYLAEEVAAGTEGAFTVKVGGVDKLIKNKTALSETDISTIAAYVTDDDKIAQKTVTGTNPAEFNNLADGYYYVKSTTGALVVIDSTQPAVSIKDKNTVPELDKKITGATSYDEDGKKALAQVGTTVNYSSTIKVGKGAINYVYHDKMDAGLTYNNDVKVFIGENEVAATNYTLDTASGDTFTVNFKNDYIKTLEVGTVLTIKYSAVVNNDAVTVDPLKNTAKVNYGDDGSDNHTPESKTEVYEAKFTVTKKDGAGAALKDAGFVIKNADGKFYKLTKGEGTAVVSWVDSINEADEHFSDAEGKVPAFTGLANGTYTLVEKTVPTGYNGAADSNFTIAKGAYTSANLEQEATVVNNQGTELPSTGGIGTTIFYVVGGLLLVGAAIVLVARRKANN